MKIFFLNYRAIGNDNTRRCLFEFCRQYSSNIVGLPELVIQASLISQLFLSSIGIELLAVNAVDFPSLLVLVSRRVSASVLVAGSQHVSVSIDNCLHTVSSVYGATIVLDRRVLWDELHWV